MGNPAGTGLAQQPPASPGVFEEYVRTEWKLLCEKRLATPDVSIVDLAKSLGYSHQTLRIWLRDPAYQRYENWMIDQRRDSLVGVPLRYETPGRYKGDTVPERFQEYCSQMQDRLLDIIETSGSERLVAELAKDWLAYGGIVQKSTPQQANLAPQITAEQLYIFVSRAKEAGLPVVLPRSSGTLKASDPLEAEILEVRPVA